MVMKDLISVPRITSLTIAIAIAISIAIAIISTIAIAITPTRSSKVGETYKWR
jgi:hypothetical protein